MVYREPEVTIEKASAIPQQKMSVSDHSADKKFLHKKEKMDLLLFDLIFNKVLEIGSTRKILEAIGERQMA